MTPSTLWNEALSLPENERRSLARVLLDSLPIAAENEPLSPAMIAELSRRYEEYLANPGDTIPAEEVFKELGVPYE